MKKTIALVALALLTTGLTSCKKEEKTNVETTSTEGTDLTAATNADSAATIQTSDAMQSPISNGDEEMIKAATSIPLTTVALAQAHYEFGNIKKGDKKDHVYEITNTGKNPLVISEVKPGCGCTAPDYTKDPILPGQKGKITLSFDSTSFDGHVEKYADVYANVEKAPMRLTFSANVQP